jgi:hypothetical protein
MFKNEFTIENIDHIKGIETVLDHYLINEQKRIPVLISTSELKKRPFIIDNWTENALVSINSNTGIVDFFYLSHIKELELGLIRRI